MTFEEFVKQDPIGAAATHFSRWVDADVSREHSSVDGNVITLRDARGVVLIRYDICKCEMGLAPLPPKGGAND